MRRSTNDTQSYKKKRRKKMEQRRGRTKCETIRCRFHNESGMLDEPKKTLRWWRSWICLRAMEKKSSQRTMWQTATQIKWEKYILMYIISNKLLSTSNSGYSNKKAIVRNGVSHRTDSDFLRIFVDTTEIIPFVNQRATNVVCIFRLFR